MAFLQQQSVTTKAREFWQIYNFLTTTAGYQLRDTKTGSDFTTPGDALVDGDWFVVGAPSGAPVAWEAKLELDDTNGLCKMTLGPYGGFNISTDVFDNPSTTDGAVEFELEDTSKITVIANAGRFILWGEGNNQNACYCGAINIFEIPGFDTNPAVLWAGPMDVNDLAGPFYGWRRISPVDNTTELVSGSMLDVVDHQASASPFDATLQPHKSSLYHTNIDGLLNFSDASHEHLAGQLLGFGLGSEGINRESGPPAGHFRFVLNGVSMEWTGSAVLPP